MKVEEKTIYTMAHRGHVTGLEGSVQWRFLRTGLEAWIDTKARRVAGEEEST